MEPPAVVCLPTYNEAGNIFSAIKEVLRVLPRSYILVIDDSSPDHTGDIADHLAEKDRRIKVIRRKSKQGLGKAYVEGFGFAVSCLDADIVFQMDADMSHPPGALPKMLSAAQESDLVIGSRYIPGGMTRNWSLPRRMISRFGSFYARGFLGLPVHDLTGGFKAWKKELLKRVLQFPISSGGYAFQAETTFLAYQLGARITEVPICFTERKSGKSKMSTSIALEAAWRIPFIRFSKYHRKISENCSAQ